MTWTSPNAADHDVRGLEVAVDDALLVRVADRLRDLLEDRQEPTALEERRQPVEHAVGHPFEVIRSGRHWRPRGRCALSACSRACRR